MTSIQAHETEPLLMRERLAWECVAPLYQETHRVYHGIAHVHSILREIDGAPMPVDKRDWLEAVAWLHDAYYDTLGVVGCNERRSADILDGTLGSAFTDRGRELARNAILASAHHLQDQQDLPTMVAWFLDLDIAGLASEERDFNRYTRAVAEEFRRAGKSTESICQSHEGFARKMLARERIYYLNRHATKEPRARANLKRLAKDPLLFV